MSYTGPVHKVYISYSQVIHRAIGPQVGTGIAWVTKGRHWVKLMFDNGSVSVLVDTYRPYMHTSCQVPISLDYVDLMHYHW